ncbi:MAG: NAD(P)H-dependent oxidoreductase subunit E, partial [Elusimicrobiota bacterium]
MSVQETRGDLTAPELERLRAWAGVYPYPEMGLIEALRELQAARGHISLEAEARAAEVFQAPLHQVHEVVTFYPYFTTAPAAKHRISVCANL